MHGYLQSFYLPLLCGRRLRGDTMNETQVKIWNMLTELDGETVARLFTDYYGNQLLTDEFLEFIVAEGV